MVYWQKEKPTVTLAARLITAQLATGAFDQLRKVKLKDQFRALQLGYTVEQEHSSSCTPIGQVMSNASHKSSVFSLQFPFDL